VLEQESNGVVDGSGLDRVVVVEDEREVFVYRGDLVDERRQNRLDGWQLGRMEGLEEILPDADPKALQSGYQVRQKAPEVVISVVQRDPRYRQLALEAPLAEQRGLAEPRWCRYKRQFAFGSLVQLLDKAWARYKVGLDEWDMQLRRK
jgi:hypothetical protein